MGSRPIRISVHPNTRSHSHRAALYRPHRVTEGIEANVTACEAAVEQSLSMVTSLNPHIGYEKASKLAKEAFESGQTIRELCQEQEILPEETLQEALDPFRMTEPQE